MQLNAHELPHIEVPPGGMDLDDLMDVTARLADVLEQETTYLRTMEVDALAKLHAKKTELMLMLEAYQRLLKSQPDFLKSAGAEKLAQFAELSEDLTAVVEENFRRTAVARAVNQRVVNTIIETMSEHNRPGTYNRYGNSNLKQDMSLSFNLNHKA
jgi:flagellar biosynthesis/type III secretory pathway chaperone